MKVVVRNMTWLLLSQITTWSTSIVMLVIAPRYLGDTDYGKVQFAITFVTFFQLAASAGTDTYVVKMVARDESRAGRYVYNALLMKIVLSITFGGLAIGLGAVLGYSAEILRLIAVFCVSMMMMVLSSTFIAGLQGMQRMGRVAAAAAIQELVSNALGLYVLYRHGSLAFYAMALTAGAVVPLVLNASKFWPHLREDRRVDFDLWKEITRGGVPFLMWRGVVMIYGSIDLPILESLSGSTTVGWYTVAYRWVGLPAFFASIVGTAVLPSLSSRYETTYGFAEQANKAIRLVYFVGAPIATGIILVAGDVLHLLYPNSGFSHAVPVMQILSLHLPIVTMTMMIGTALIAGDRQNRWAILGCIAAVLNIGLNLIAIPLTMRMFDNGAIGAAVITVFTECVILAGSIYLRPAGVLDAAAWKSLLRCTLACLAMVPPVLVVGSAPLAVKVAVGVVTYVAASLVLRSVTIDEVRTGFTQGFRSAGRAA